MFPGPAGACWFTDVESFAMASPPKKTCVGGWGWCGGVLSCAEGPAKARVISRRWNDDDESSFLVEETGVPGGNHRPTASNWWNRGHGVAPPPPSASTSRRCFQIGSESDEFYIDLLCPIRSLYTPNRVWGDSKYNLKLIPDTILCRSIHV